MCGIIGGFQSSIELGIQALSHRGPDAQGITYCGEITFGHTRLSILDTDSRSNQPFTYDGLTLVYNGELWNYLELKAELLAQGYLFKTTGDTEVVAVALKAWGEDALKRFDGMYALAWTVDGETLFIARDPFGEIPLYIAKQTPFLFASERKALLAIGAHRKAIDLFPAGHCVQVKAQRIMASKSIYSIPISISPDDQETASQKVYALLDKGTEKRMISDVPICTLISGGIDSTAILYFLKKYHPDITAYTAVFNPKSQDLRNARLACQDLDVDLVEVPVPIPTAEDITTVIQQIEMPYKAQIEIGWACLFLAKQVQADGFKVIFSGEASDELWGSYGFAYHALKTKDWHEYRKELFMSQERKNFIRCNKIFMAHGIECRLPFIHTPLVEYAISLKQNTVQNTRQHPKYVFQRAMQGTLPDSIVFRSKVAFQDGMGLKQAIQKTIPSPKRFYNAEYKRLYG